MATVRKPPLARMKLPEFLAWEPDDPSVCSWQLIDGEPMVLGSEDAIALASIGFRAAVKSFYRTAYLALP